ncbi:peptide deformylase [Sulfurimonas sp. HSL-1716]|uniref:peptide deformylase n=1 Tax=Hydrocurvibacter sulfurireducens TaxID=3131937 RepID=UPI0031F8039D
MVKEIVKYPTTPSLEYGANVRHFNDELFAIIEDLKDTMEANGITALAAFQISSPLSVIVIKQENGEYLEIINPRVIKREGKIHPIETTAYFPELSAKTTRYEKIKVMYEDKEQNQKFLEAEGDLAVVLQRKMDYLFGANFRVRLDKDEKKLFDSKLEFGTDAIMKNDCPTVFKRDRLLKLLKILFAIGFVSLGAKFFIDASMLPILKTAENYIMIAMLTTSVIYFFYAQYEGKQYKHCTSCQIGNIIGSTAISLIRLIILFVANYFLLW